VTIEHTHGSSPMRCVRAWIYKSWIKKIGRKSHGLLVCSLVATVVRPVSHPCWWRLEDPFSYGYRRWTCILYPPSAYCWPQCIKVLMADEGGHVSSKPDRLWMFSIRMLVSVRGLVKIPGSACSRSREICVSDDWRIARSIFGKWGRWQRILGGALWELRLIFRVKNLGMVSGNGGFQSFSCWKDCLHTNLLLTFFRGENP
jgi:hypothetical protein